MARFVGLYTAIAKSTDMIVGKGRNELAVSFNSCCAYT